jgi:nucleotide-binding universal stress UspA family protein
MTTNSRIVVGVDGSAASVDAVRWAARQADLTGSGLDAIIGWRCPTQYGNDLQHEATNWPDLAQTTLATAVTEAEAYTAAACTQTVTEGHPKDVPVNASQGADLLVARSRGHSRLAGMLLGSGSEHVIGHAHCHVVVIRHQPATPPTPTQEKP